MSFGNLFLYIKIFIRQLYICKSQCLPRSTEASFFLSVTRLETVAEILYPRGLASVAKPCAQMVTSMRKATERKKRHPMWLVDELASASVLALVILPRFQLRAPALHGYCPPRAVCLLSQLVSSPEHQGRAWVPC